MAISSCLGTSEVVGVSLLLVFWENRFCPLFPPLFILLLLMTPDDDDL